MYNVCNKELKGKNLDAVILCGANANIDSCKSNPKASNALNVLGMKRIINQMGDMGIKCVFLSSEAVFDGKKGLYTEGDVTNPITLYGRQKLQIEQYIISNLKNYIIFRISRAVGSTFGEEDIFNEFYTKIISCEEIKCLKNQSFCLTEISDIVYGITKALEQDIQGLYHLSSDNYISRYDLAQFYANKIFGGYEKIVEKDYIDMNFLDNRHIFGGLSGKKSEKLLGIHYMDIDKIMYKYKASYKKFI